MKDEQCSGLVHNDYGVGFHRCLKKVTCTFEGKPYCGQHNPGRDKTKEIAREAVRDAKYKYENAQKAMGWFGKQLYDALEMLVTEGGGADVVIAKKVLRDTKPYRELLKKGKPT